MSFLGEQELIQILKGSIEPFDINHIDGNKYELSLGSKYYATDSEFKVSTAENEQIVINPGQFCFLETLEEIQIPDTYMAFLSIKTKIKFKGLVNISGFHVDPGFKGKLVYSVLNSGATPINLTVGKPMFQLWLTELTSPSHYKGSSQGQTGVSGVLLNEHMAGSDIASPADLQRQIHELTHKTDKIDSHNAIIKWIVGIISVLVIASIGRFLIDYRVSSQNNLRTEIKDKVILELKKDDIRMEDLEKLIEKIIQRETNRKK